MHAFLTSDNPDLPNNPDTLRLTPDISLGIDEVRQIQIFLSRKPLQTHHTVIINSAHLLTIPAQNALLKTLEEPPPGTLIYLVTNQPSLLLPTILSRLQTIASFHALPPKNTLLQQLISSDLKKRLALLDSLGLDRTSALAMLDEFESAIHSDLSLHPAFQTLAQTRKFLLANVNLKLALDYLAINLLTYPSNEQIF